MRFLVQPLIKNSYAFPGNDASNKYSIAVVNGGHTLTVNANGIDVQQHPWNETAAQQWKFEKQPDGFYIIKAVGTGKVLGVKARALTDEAKIVILDSDNDDSQRWKLVYLGASTFRIENKKSGKVADIYGGATTAGAQLQQFGWHGGGNQRFRINELVSNQLAAGLGNKVVIFGGASFQGKQQALGPGSYDMKDLAIGSDQLSSLRCPPGLRVTLYADPGFRGAQKVFTQDAGGVGADFNDKTSSILVDIVATAYADDNYQGAAQSFGIGTYDMDSLTVGNDRISSIRIPTGMQVELFTDANYKGQSLVLHSDVASLPNFNNRTSSLIVKMRGVTVPDNALCFGDGIKLRSKNGKAVKLDSDMRLSTKSGDLTAETRYIVVRAGKTMNQTYVSYGDVIALKATNGKYVTWSASTTMANAAEIGQKQRWVIFRAGAADSRTFVNKDDVVALRRASGTTYLHDGGTTGFSTSGAATLDKTSRFVIAALQDNTEEGGELCGAKAAAIDSCGSNACPVDACGAQGFAVTLCGADACAAAVCGAQAAIVNMCGAAASAVVLCGADVGGMVACGVDANEISACGGNICGAAVCAVAACGADACGGAACGLEACGAAACAAAGCGGNACATDACPADLCGANACGGNACAVAAALGVCPVDACGANACAIDACPLDACLADACAIDVIPIIPGI